MSDDGILHFNPWMDFNDGPPSENPFGCDPDPEQIAVFLDTVFSWCEGLIPLRGFVDKGQGRDGKPHNIWIPADDTAPEKLATFAAWANREGAAVYVIPGTVEEQGQARAADVLQMQAIVVDLDAGDIPAKLDHVTRHLGAPTLIIESGGRTSEGAAKLHVWWRLTEPAEGDDLATLCRLRGEIAVKVGGDTHFRSAHQPIRVPGTVYHKHGHQRLVQIREHRDVEVDLADFAEKVADMPPLPGVGFASDVSSPQAKPGIDSVLTTPVREGAVDDWSRFQGASAAIGHYVRLVHEGRLDPFAGWEAICGYNAAMLRPSWPLDRLMAESERLWALHVKRNGPPLLRAAHVDAPAIPLPTFTLIGECEPAFVFLENVAHHLRLGFPEVAGDLVGLGYRIAAGLFTAAEVGAPHRRERLFILAHREGDVCADPVRLLADAGRGRQQGDAEPDQRAVHTGGAASRRDDAQRCDAAVDDAGHPGRGPVDATGDLDHRQDAGRQEGDGRAGEPGESLDDANGAGSQGRGDEPREHAGERPAWPPGPDDVAGWRRYLRDAPELEPAVRRGADGLAHRVDRLRLCGNGVVPLVAAHALRTLAAELAAG